MKLSYHFSIRLIFAFVAGIAGAQQFHSIPNAWALAAILMICFVFWLSQQKIPACFLLGLVYALIFASIRLNQAPPATRQTMLIKGQIISLPKKLENGLRFDFKPDAFQWPSRIRLFWRADTENPKAGERWRLKVRLQPVHGLLNPGGMDYEGYLFAQNIQATGYVLNDAENQKIDTSSFSPETWRQFLYDRLSEALNESELSGIIKALAMGSENDITSQQWEVFKKTGTTHLVAISGSHISLIAGIFYFIALKLSAFFGWQALSPPKLAACIAFIAALFYSALADFALPTQRALIMIAVIMGSSIAQRNAKPFYTLALALLIVTLYDPWSVLSPGFWLSFLAVGLIFSAVTPRLGQAGWLKDLWQINWMTSLGLAPLLLLFFQQVSLISPVANLIAVPSMGLIATPLCLLSSALLLIHLPSGLLILQITEKFLHFFWQILERLAALPFTQWQHQSPPAWALSFSILGVLLLLMPKGLPGRYMGLILLTPALTIHPEPPDSGSFNLTMLDVGQKLCIIIQTNHHSLVYGDLGKASPKMIEAFMHGLGIETIDGLILSGEKNDHAARRLIETFKIKKIIGRQPHHAAITAYPVSHRGPGTQAGGWEPGPGTEPCRAGTHWQWDGIEFEMISNACVLKVKAGPYSALITANISTEEENTLIEGDQLASDVIVAPHHGSKFSSGRAFISRVNPRYALFSTAYKNHYHFPNPEVLKRYHENGAKTYNSAETGAIRLHIDGARGSTPPESYRQTQGRYWNALR